MEVAHGLLTQWEVTSCLSLPPWSVASHCSCFAGDGADASGPYIPGRLKSQHPQIPQQEKTIHQLLSDRLSMIKATHLPQHYDSDSPTCLQSPVLSWPLSLVSHSLHPQLQKPPQHFCSQQETICNSHSSFTLPCASCSPVNFLFQSNSFSFIES